MPAPKFAEIAPRYSWMFGALQVNADRVAEVRRVRERIVAGRARYEAVAVKLPNPPWWIIGLLHLLECDLSFEKHLHNGDPLRARTVNVPAGRPKVFPCTWEESAWDAVRYDQLHTWTDWSVAGALFKMEAFNGYGYHSKGIHSPYLWAGSQHYTRGKYVADGVYDPNAVSKQLGVAVVLHALCARGDVALKATGGNA